MTNETPIWGLLQLGAKSYAKDFATVAFKAYFRDNKGKFYEANSFNAFRVPRSHTGSRVL